MKPKNLVVAWMLVLSVIAVGCSGKRRSQEKDDKENLAKLAPTEYRKVADCTTAKEYITTLEFLRSHTEFSLNEAQSREMAERVANECSGAADKFIRVTHVLLKGGLTAKDALNLGLEMMHKSQIVAETFIHVFKFSFTEEGLDLDLQTSVKLAKSLSSEFNGDHEVAVKDFHKMLKFCLKSDGLDMARPDCGFFAARVAKLSEDPTLKKKEGVEKYFLTAYHFMTSDSGINLTRPMALKTAEDLLQVSPLAIENFIQSYKYATAKRGLALGAEDAFKFAKDLAMKTRSKSFKDDRSKSGSES